MVVVQAAAARLPRHHNDGRETVLRSGDSRRWTRP